MDTMRQRFYQVTSALLDRDPRLAVVLAAIGAAELEDARRRHPDRVINLGIREQLLISVAGGLALAGLRPVAHTFAPFLVERPFEQVKLDLGHQAADAVLVSAGGSYDYPAYGLTVLQRGSGGTVIAVGPVADDVLAATAGLDVTVLYAATIRPFDRAGLRTALGARDATAVVVVEPYLAGTSSAAVGEALSDIPHRVLGLGVGRAELRKFGTMAEHVAAHGLDPASLRPRIAGFLGLG